MNGFEHRITKRIFDKLVTGVEKWQQDLLTASNEVYRGLRNWNVVVVVLTFSTMLKKSGRNEQKSVSK